MGNSQPFLGNNNFGSFSNQQQSLYSKPWQNSQFDGPPSPWQNSPSSVWTPSHSGNQHYDNNPAPMNPALAGRPPSEQLQITKCRSGQSCEKCRQLNCYWDNTAKILNRCIALGLEQTQIPIEKGQAQNLGSCPAPGTQGSLGVNWLAIEALSPQSNMPNLDTMSDSDVQRWLSSLPYYNPDATEVNYPAGNAFRELLPTAASQYANGKIPSTTPWVSFFDGLNNDWYGDDDDDTGYYIDGGYTYDLPPNSWNSWGSGNLRNNGNSWNANGCCAPSSFSSNSWSANGYYDPSSSSSASSSWNANGYYDPSSSSSASSSWNANGYYNPPSAGALGAIGSYPSISSLGSFPSPYI